MRTNEVYIVVNTILLNTHMKEKINNYRNGNTYKERGQIKKTNTWHKNILYAHCGSTTAGEFRNICGVIHDDRQRTWPFW
jgi:hypothetical protein